MIEALQWIGAALGVTGAYFVASENAATRAWGFVGFLLSNLFWLAYGYLTGQWGLVVMQAVFCLTSGRGLALSRRLAKGTAAAPRDRDRAAVETRHEPLKGDPA